MKQRETHIVEDLRKKLDAGRVSMSQAIQNVKNCRKIFKYFSLNPKRGGYDDI